jgi:hypothetical protein
MPWLASSAGRTLQELPDGREVMVRVSSEPASWRCVEVCGSDHDQTNAVRGDELLAAGVVEGPLDAAADSADGQTIRLVEVGYGVVVLEFAVTDVRLCRESDVPRLTRDMIPGWRQQWGHRSRLIELARRVARGFRDPHNYRLRMLLIGGGLRL